MSKTTLKYPLLFSLLLLLLFCTGCSKNLPCNIPLHGLDEFVMDSHQIAAQRHWEDARELQILNSCCLDEQANHPVIHEHDVLNIVLYSSRDDLKSCFKELSCTNHCEVVNGTILLPQLSPIRVDGLSLLAVKYQVEELYRNHFRADEIEVFITFGTRYGYDVQLITSDGTFCVPIHGHERMLDVLCGQPIKLKDYDLCKSVVIRQNQVLPVDLAKLLYCADLSHNIPMHPGDKVFIGMTCLEEFNLGVVVLGEVGSPDSLYTHGKPLSLRQAIGMVRGFSEFTADHRFIIVVRGRGHCAKVYVVDWNETYPLSNSSLLLFPGDMVYVTAKPITEWNRFIDQLLPSLSTYMLGAQGAVVRS